MLLKLLGEITQRVEASGGNWPQRQYVVACGCVCKRWRGAAAEVVERPHSAIRKKITFPSSLKKSGSRDSPIHCLKTRQDEFDVLPLSSPHAVIYRKGEVPTSFSC